VRLERNLNPSLSKLYIISGIMMIVAALLMLKLLGTALTIVLVAAGGLSILSGYLRH
jgi:uncharacterized membrane protein HdeD (DUF308 family)